MKINPILARWRIKILTLEHCILCGKSKSALCQQCILDLPWVKQHCSRCGIKLNGSVESHTICGHCQKKSLLYQRCIPVFNYEQPIIYLLNQLKFHQHLSISRLLGKLMITPIYQHYESSTLPSAIIPVSLHHSRLKARGFNQALELTRPIAKAFNIPILNNKITRVKNTSPQSLLLAKDREKNIRNAFQMKNPLKNTHIAIVDDIVTTGNTIHEFCHILQKAGAEKIDVWCCARA